MNFLLKEIKQFKKNKALFLLGLPAMIALFFVSYVPMFGLIIAFKNYTYDKGIFGSTWAGLNNFKFFFTSQDAFRVTRNTLLLNSSFIILSFAFAVIVALMLNELSKRSVKVFQTVLFVPYFISWIVVGYLVYGFLSFDYGAINSILKTFHIAPIDWYSNPNYWPAILILSYLWKNVGYLTIIFYTGILGIDSTFYEAAEIDGATKFQQVRTITVPLIKPLIILMLMLSIGRIFYSDFGLFFFVPREVGALLPTTDVIDTYVYRSLRVIGDLGMASAAGFYQSIVGFLLVMGTNLFIRKVSKEDAVF
ncbi:MAG TPA: ABC transporter permease subunit [Ruminiclostridium sp.]